MFVDVFQNPRDIECLKDAEIFKENDIDLVLAVGEGQCFQIDIHVEAMRKIISNLLKAYKDGSNLKACLEMLEGSLFASMCFGSAEFA
ncbi:hypothetical protein NCCP28_29070 [Niallia sp. NCCP-28]|nr:hypothetical protein NCCP28_29070 [Niallia sp. NCCP-28]